MSGKKAFVSLAVITTAGFLGTAAATWSSERNDKDPDAIVIPCSLYGINPVLHPNIFTILLPPKHSALSDRGMAHGM